MSDKISLYELSKEAETLNEIFESCIDSETGEVLEGEVIDELGKELAVAIQSKSTAIIQVYKNQMALIPAIDEEIKRFTAMKKLAINNNERFESYIKMCMI
ncbi:MAG: siphovirus Gp157 family protein, partial [Fusobacteriaceae bacterium]